MKDIKKNTDDGSLGTPVTQYDLLVEKMNSMNTNLNEKINSLSNSIKTIYWIFGINFAIMLSGFALLYNAINQ